MLKVEAGKSEGSKIEVSGHQARDWVADNVKL